MFISKGRVVTCGRASAKKVGSLSQNKHERRRIDLVSVFTFDSYWLVAFKKVRHFLSHRIVMITVYVILYSRMKRQAR